MNNFSVVLLNNVILCSLLVSCGRYGDLSPYDLLAANWMYSRNSTLEQTITFGGQKVCPAPDFELYDLAGQKVRLSDFRGMWVILDFWGIWSEWSMKEFEKLRDFCEENKNRCVLIGICCEDSKELWESTIDKVNAPGIQLYSPITSDLTKIYNVEAFPSKYIINPAGYIVYGISGCPDTFLYVMNEYLEQDSIERQNNREIDDYVY